MLLLAATLCLLSSERPMVEAELFFGRDVAGRAPVSEAEWSDFADSVIARDFPGGFTVGDGDGTWRDQKTSVVHEKSKIVVIAAPRSRELGKKLRHVIGAYRTRFHQEAVGLVTRDVCAAF